MTNNGALRAYLAVAMGLIIAYDVAVHYPFVLRVFTANNLLWEYVVVLIVLLCAYFPKVKLDAVAIAAPVMLILLPFGAFDLFYHYLRRAPRPSDLQNIWTIADFSPALIAGAGVLAAVSFALVLLLLWRASRVYPRRRFILLVGLKLAFFVVAGCLVVLRPSAGLKRSLFEYVHWSEDLTVRINGRLSSFAFYAQEEREARRQLLSTALPESAVIDRYFPGDLRRTPNIHLVVLESFIDPRMLEGITFKPSPLAEELTPFLHGGSEFSRVISPVFGGNSAQAEFELLTGIKAFGRINTSDFNVMRGGPIDGFARRLKEQGYMVVATIASGAAYYNAPTAYKSIGVAEARFLGEEPRPQDPAGSLLFDGDLFADNLAMLRRLAASDGDRPVLNYVVGMYGHHPFARNSGQRPDVIASDANDDRVNRISNQFYYRTQVIGRFIAQIRAMDPDGIIYITSDHLPPIFSGGLKHRSDLRSNSALLLIDGRPVDVTGRYYYEIPWLIWDELTGQAVERPTDPASLDEAYVRALLQSMKLGP